MPSKQELGVRIPPWAFASYALLPMESHPVWSPEKPVTQQQGDHLRRNLFYDKAC